MSNSKLKRFLSAAMCLVMLAMCVSCSGKGGSANGTAAFPSSVISGASSAADSGSGVVAPTGGAASSQSGDAFDNVPPAPKAFITPAVKGLTPVGADARYGRQKLSEMPNSTALLNVYDRVVASVAACQAYIIINPNNDPKLFITEAEICKVLLYYKSDYPQSFWLNTNNREGLIKSEYSDIGNGEIFAIWLDMVLTATEVKVLQAEFDAAVAEILDGIDDSWSEYDREKTIHDRLLARVEYTKDTDNPRNSYGALVDKKCVCVGYAKAFQYLCYQAGIQCLYVSGMADYEIDPSLITYANHVWNIVKLDGKYYQVDPTWDDAGDSDFYYSYFNMSDKLMRPTHIVDEKNTYPLPKCDSLDMSYYTKNSAFISKPYSLAKIAAVVRSGKCGKDTAYIYVCDTDGFEEWFFDDNFKTIARMAGINRFTKAECRVFGNEAYIHYCR